jgi:hypothetical protein
LVSLIGWRDPTEKRLQHHPLHFLKIALPNRIHLKDLAGLIIHSVENNQVKGVLNGVAPQLINNQVGLKRSPVLGAVANFSPRASRNL